MPWFNHLLIWFFPPRYTRLDLQKIPHAPDPKERNIFALYDYHYPQGKKLIYYIKKQEDRFVSQYISEYMAEALQEYIAEQQQYSFFLNPIIIPVPITRKQKKLRGFNQSHRIGKYLADILGGKYSENILYKSKENQKQALITSRSQRFDNVRNCFSVNNNISIKHKDIIIVDDLVTTGATIAEIEKTLRTTGARNVIAITVAH